MTSKLISKTALHTIGLALAAIPLALAAQNVTSGGSQQDWRSENDEEGQLKRGLEKGLAACIADLREQARPVLTKDQIAHVASISANDKYIGELIADVMEKVGKDGVITVEESRGIKFETEFVDGLQLDRG